MNTQDRAFIGQAKTVLVLEAGEQQAVVTTLTAKCVPPGPAGAHVFASGPVSFDDAALGHLNAIVLACVRATLEPIHLPLPSFELSITNVSGTSIGGLGLRVHGYSSDLSAYIAMLSAATLTPADLEVLFSAHLASSSGDIRPVDSIPAKVDAALASGEVETFVTGDVFQDEGLSRISPIERDRAIAALTSAKAAIRIVVVRDVSDAVKTAFSDESVVLGSLQSGFFDRGERFDSGLQSPERAGRFLANQNGLRFWRSLEASLIGARATSVRALLEAWITYHCGRRRYPSNFGSRLRQLLSTVPPATRRLKLEFPLCPTQGCLAIVKLAGPDDVDDVRLLIEAVTGSTNHSIDERVDAHARSAETVPDTEASVSTVLSRIAPQYLDTSIGVPIDGARATFVLDSTIAGSYHDFQDTISGFYLHLLRHLNRVSPTLAARDVRPDAHALLKRAYARDGGVEQAWAKARSGSEGGLRSVLDDMTETFKHEEKEHYVNLVLKEAFDPLDQAAKVAFMTDLLRALTPHLPPEIVSQPPQRFAAGYEEITRAYVNAMDRLHRVLRAM